MGVASGAAEGLGFGVAIAVGVAAGGGGGVGCFSGTACFASVGSETSCVCISTNGRSFPSCEGSGASPVAGSVLAAIEFAFDSNVFSFGGSADSFAGSVSI